MHSISRFLLFALALAGCAVADTPVKPPLTKYKKLWEESPFTSKPPPTIVEETVANPLEDYSLAGVSPIGNGYRVTILNKKKPEERISLDSGQIKEGFKILAVTRKPGDPLGTVVRMSSGTATGTIAFENEFLAVATPPAAKPNSNAPPVVNPASRLHVQPPTPSGQTPMRQSRPRVVPPPVRTQPTPSTQRPDLRSR